MACSRADTAASWPPHTGLLLNVSCKSVADTSRLIDGELFSSVLSGAVGVSSTLNIDTLEFELEVNGECPSSHWRHLVSRIRDGAKVLQLK